MSDKKGLFETINRISAYTKKEFSFTDTILSAYKKKAHQDKGLSLHLLVISINKKFGRRSKGPVLWPDDKHMISGVVYLNRVARKNAAIITSAWPFLQHRAGQHEYKNCNSKSK